MHCALCTMHSLGSVIFMNVILASQSPRRKELMGLFKRPFTVRVADVDETIEENEPAAQAVARLSRLKALAIPREADEVIVAADTVVVCDAEILGKPADEADAFRMLKMLSGRRHQVMTGVTVLYGEKLRSHTEVTDIYFRELSDREILDYIATGEPMDKAGSYGIQGGAALFAEKISGDYFNVVGLPVCRLGQLLREVLEDTI